MVLGQGGPGHPGSFRAGWPLVVGAYPDAHPETIANSPGKDDSHFESTHTYWRTPPAKQLQIMDPMLYDAGEIVRMVICSHGNDNALGLNPKVYDAHPRRTPPWISA